MTDIEQLAGEFVEDGLREARGEATPEQSRSRRGGFGSADHGRPLKHRRTAVAAALAT